MSIGPQQKDESLNTSVVNRLQYSAKKLTETFFVDPVHYLFYGSLTLLIIGLFCNKEFQWQFYAVVILLALTELSTSLWKHYSHPQI